MRHTRTHAAADAGISLRDGAVLAAMTREWHRTSRYLGVGTGNGQCAFHVEEGAIVLGAQEGR